MRNLYADSLEPLTGMTLPFIGTSIGGQEPKTGKEGGENKAVAIIKIIIAMIIDHHCYDHHGHDNYGLTSADREGARPDSFPTPSQLFQRIVFVG